MAAEASLAMSIKDNLSAAIVSMRNGMTAFRMDASELGKELDRLNSAKVSLKLELSQATEAAKKAQKTFRDLGRSGADAAEQAAAEAEWRKAEEQLENVRQQYNLVSQQAKETTKQLENVTGAISKAENRAGSGSGSGGLLSALSKAGLMDMVGDSMGELANTAIGSMFGSEAGSLISGALSGAMSGAAMGSLAGPVGTAIGAVIGGASGLLSSGTQAFQARDEAFKSYYGDLYNEQKTALESSRTAGIATASTRELDLSAMSTLMDDDAEAAKRFQEQLIEIGRTPPFSYDTVADMSKSMLGLGLSTEEVTDRISALGEAAAALGWKESGVGTIVSTLESAQLSGKLESRVLKTLSKQGVNVYGALADEFGISEDAVAGKIGDMDVERAIAAIYRYMGTEFSGAADGLTDTYSGASGILDSLKEDLVSAMGEGYNQERTQGLKDEIDAYSGALGEAMSNLNTISGQTQAMLDNLKDQYQREALSAVLVGDQGGELFAGEDRALLDQLRAEYVAAEAAYEESVRETGKGNLEAGLKMEALKEETIALATAAYDSSQEVQTLQSVEREQITATRELTAAFSGWANSYSLQQEFTKGQAGATKENPIAAIFTSGPDYDPDYDLVEEFWGDPWGPSHAFGLERVPYDDYPALLHEGERVLTASQAREQDQGGSAPIIHVTVSGNTFGAGLDEAAVAQAIASEMLLQLEAGAGRG